MDLVVLGFAASAQDCLVDLRDFVSLPLFLTLTPAVMFQSCPCRNVMKQHIMVRMSTWPLLHLDPIKKQD